MCRHHARTEKLTIGNTPTSVCYSEGRFCGLEGNFCYKDTGRAG